MTLNCKVGDLAIVVRSVAGNEGKIVRCLELLPSGIDGAHPRQGALWRTDRALNRVEESGLKCSPANLCPDSFLRPIRPLDEPETITTDDEVTA